MKILVAYYTQSGNTEKIARAIFETVQSEKHEVHLKNLDDIQPENLTDYDLVFLGSACHDADLAEPVQIFLDAVSTAPSFKLAGFVTHSAANPDAGDGEQELYQKWAGRCIVTFEQSSKEKEIDFLDITIAKEHHHLQSRNSYTRRFFLIRMSGKTILRWQGTIRTTMTLRRLWISLVRCSWRLRHHSLAEGQKVWQNPLIVKYLLDYIQSITGIRIKIPG